MGGHQGAGEWPERVSSLLVEIHGTEGRRQAGIDEMMGYLRQGLRLSEARGALVGCLGDERGE